MSTIANIEKVLHDAGIICYGDTVPTDGTAGYVPGAIFRHTDNTNHTDAIYCNIGTAASCNFNKITVASD